MNYFSPSSHNKRVYVYVSVSDAWITYPVDEPEDIMIVVSDRKYF